jgi:aminopeptidase N
MADANGRDLTQFERWYSQAGTPRVIARSEHDPLTETFTLELEQFCPPTPGQSLKETMHIPVAVGLLDARGADLPLQLESTSTPDEVEVHQAPTTVVLELTESKQSFTFTGIAQPPVPSLLRNFSAPVVLDYDYSDEQLAFLLAHDSDPFNRWEAGQRLATRRLLHLADSSIATDLRYAPTAQDELLAGALRKLLCDVALDPAFRDLVMTLPSETMLAEQVDLIDPQSLHRARRALRRYLAQALRTELLEAYQKNHTHGAYRPDPVPAGRRALRNNALGYLSELNDSTAHKLIQDQLDHASNMTDRIAALTAMVHHSAPGVEDALEAFYADFDNEALVIDKWFSLQASAPGTDVYTVRKLMKHPAFTLKNPNRARSLIFVFCSGNPAQFHAADGSGHAFWAEQVVALDAINPQVAARLARSMDRWRKFTPALQASMRAALEKVSSARKLSNDVAEVIGKALSN